MGLYVVLSKKSVALCLAVLLAGGLCLSAQKSKLPGEDWVSLFNGEDLTGWSKVGAESWTVEDKVIQLSEPMRLSLDLREDDPVRIKMSAWQGQSPNANKPAVLM